MNHTRRNKPRFRNYPVFDANVDDADEITLRHPIGIAGTPEQAKAIVGHFFATHVDDGDDPITVYAVGLEKCSGVVGWFPVWQ